MKHKTTAWAVFNRNHPTDNENLNIIYVDTIAFTKKGSINKFLSMVHFSWEYWQKEYNYECGEVKVNVELINEG